MQKVMEQFKNIVFFSFFGFFLGIVVLSQTHPKEFKKQIVSYLQLDQNFEEKTETFPQKTVISTNFEDFRTSIPKAIQKATSSVVGINVKFVQQYRRNDFFSNFFAPRNRIGKSSGSGFIISDDGFVITNQHVIENAQEIMVSLPSGENYFAEVVGEDKQTDIALLKLKNLKTQIPFSKLGNSMDLQIGDFVIAMGNPFGLTMINNQPTATIGIVSAVGRDFGHVEGDRVYENMIQTDAAINSGNSGGPLINMSGEVIGMNTFIYTGGKSSGSLGIAFSIPIKKVMEITELLKSGDIDRRVFSGIIGGKTITERVSRHYGIPEGLFVTHIARNSPAERAGIMINDVITEVNGYDVKNREDFTEAMWFSGLKVGDIIEIKGYGQSGQYSKKIKLEKYR
jgi:serine protease Do